MRVGIIGLGEVGMSHVIASQKNGHDIVYLVDIDDEILHQRSQKWESKWSDTYEWAEIQFGVIYANKIPTKVEVDLIIIATPPKTHDLILDNLEEFEGRILIELPAKLSDNWHSLNLEVCSQWIHHSQINNKTVLNQLEMHYIVEPRQWNKKAHLALNFCPHLFSILIFHGYHLEDMEVIESSVDSFDIDVFTNRGIVNLIGSQDSNWGLGINGSRMKFENETVEKLQTVGGISHKEYEFWELKLHSVINY